MSGRKLARELPAVRVPCAVVRVGAMSAATPQSRAGAQRTGICTLASGYMATSRAIEFIHSSRDCCCRQSGPPGGCGSTRCSSSGTPSSSSTALAQIRSTSDAPRGPAPTMQMNVAAARRANRSRLRGTGAARTSSIDMS